MGDTGAGKEAGEAEEPEDVMAYLGAFPAKVKMVEDAAEETLQLWAFQDPVRAKQNAFVAQGSLQLKLDACGQLLHILQAPSSMVIRILFLVTTILQIIGFQSFVEYNAFYVECFQR